jgi:hypothetical protein
VRRARPLIAVPAILPILGLLVATTTAAGASAAATPAGADSVLLSADGRTASPERVDVTSSAAPLDAGDAPVCVALTPDGDGAWTVTAKGDVVASGTAPALGSPEGAVDAGDAGDAGAIAGIASTPTGDGYWVVTTSGRVTASGDARSYGSPEMALSAPVVGMADTPTGDGYWLAAADGGIFAFGDARYLGSTAQLTLAQPIVGIATTPTGDGYWLAAADGGIFAFGDAPFAGARRTTDPDTAVVGIATPRGASCHAADGEQRRLDGLLAWVAATAAVPFGIVVTDLDTGVTSAIGADDAFRSASLYKLYVADLVYQDVAAGVLSLDQEAGNGTGRSVESCLDLMITISDNACGIALGSLVGWSARDGDLAAQGFTGTDLRDGDQTTTAGDVAHLFEQLANRTLLDPDGTAAFLGLLADQQVNDRLPVGLDLDVASIAHKTGNLDGFVHDAGVVTTPDRRYVIAVLSGPWSSEGLAPPVFAALSAAVYAAVEG